MRALFFVAALALTGCGGDRPGLAGDETLLSVSATGRAESRPDQARFTVGVTSIAATGPASSETNAEKMNKVVDALAALGIAKDDIQTRQLSIARQDYGPNKGKFEANNTVTVRVRDVAKAGPAIAAATGEGANVLNGPELTVADPEAAARSAYAAAFTEARARADVYAKAAGLEVKRVLAISDGLGMGGPSPMYEAMADATMRPVMEQPPITLRPPVSPGTNTDTVAVRVDFVLGK